MLKVYMIGAEIVMLHLEYSNLNKYFILMT